MPFHYRPTDIFTSGCSAIVNPVNCVGVMGAGLAMAFRRRYPSHFASYQRTCRAGRLRPGIVHVDDLGPRGTPRFLIALPTKRHWREPSRLHDVECSVRALSRVLTDRGIPSVAIPRLGCGLGGLAWHDVHAALVRTLSPLARAGGSIVILARCPTDEAPHRAGGGPR